MKFRYIYINHHKPALLMMKSTDDPESFKIAAISLLPDNTIPFIAYTLSPALILPFKSAASPGVISVMSRSMLLNPNFPLFPRTKLNVYL